MPHSHAEHQAGDAGRAQRPVDHQQQHRSGREMSIQRGSGSDAEDQRDDHRHGDAQAADACVGDAHFFTASIAASGARRLRLVRPQQQHFAIAIELRQRLRLDCREGVVGVALDFRHRRRPDSRPERSAVEPGADQQIAALDVGLDRQDRAD